MCSTTTCRAFTARHFRGKRVAVEGKDHDIGDGDVVIAAITSAPTPRTPMCWSPPAWSPQGERAWGLKPKPWVKTSLAPGSQVVTDYLDRAGLTADLDAVGFNLVGYGCTTCIGNSGPLAEPISARRSTAMTLSPRRCSRATATSKAASRPMCARTSSPRRRWWSPTR
jgi:aconitase A